MKPSTGSAARLGRRGRQRHLGRRRRRTLDGVRARLDPQPGPRIEQLVPLGELAVARYAQALSDALSAAGAESSVTIAGAATPTGTRTIAHVLATSPPLDADLYVEHDPATPGLALLRDAWGTARVLPQVVSPAVWAGMRPAHERWYDGKDVLLSIAPLGADEARRLLECSSPT